MSTARLGQARLGQARLGSGRAPGGTPVSATASDAFSVSDTATHTAARARAGAGADTVTISDAATRAAIATARTAADSFAMSDTATATTSLARSAADVWTIADTAVGQSTGGTSRAASDSVVVSDAATRGLQAPARSATDSALVSDLATRIVALARTGRGVAQASVPFPQRDYEHGLGKSVAVGSAIELDTTNPRYGLRSAKVATAGAAAFEGISSSTSTTNEVVASVSPSTTYTLSVYVRAPIGATLRPRVTERAANNAFVVNVTFANVTVATTGWARYTFTWTTQATAAFLRDFRVLTVLSAQAINFWVDGWQLDFGSTAGPYDGEDSGDTFAISDAATRTLPQARSAADSFAISDQAAARITVARSSSDNFTITDQAARNRAAARSATDSFALTDQAARNLGQRLRTAADGFALADVATRAAVSYARSAADVWTIADTAGRQGLNRSALDTWTISDVAEVYVTFVGVVWRVRGTVTAQHATVATVGPATKTRGEVLA